LAYLVARAFVSFLKCRNVVVGRDMRLSSEPLFSSFVEGVTASGVNVVDIGVVSTPFFYFGISHLKTKGGVMVTASHNPKEYNGLKVCREDAIPVYDVELKKLRDVEIQPLGPQQKDV
jgi:phosphomannomutase